MRVRQRIAAERAAEGNCRPTLDSVARALNAKGIPVGLERTLARLDHRQRP